MYIIKEGEVLVTAVAKTDMDEGTTGTRGHVYNLGMISTGQCFGERSIMTGVCVCVVHWQWQCD